ncbi:MAG: IucA/IucC family protein [Francisellaceae bacterium]
MLSLEKWRHARQYMINRLLNTFIRERLGAFDRAVANPGCPLFRYLYVDIDGFIIRIAVKPHDFLQDWYTEASHWQVNVDGNWRHRSNMMALMRRLYRSTGGCEETLKLAIAEYKQAVFQAILRPVPKASIIGYSTLGMDSLKHYDHLAAFVDHPLYPTARAKLGFSAQDLIHFSPEYQNDFTLIWLAIDKRKVTLTDEMPDFWPSFSDVGLLQSLSQDFQLFPVHPFTLSMTLQALKDHHIDYRLAPLRAITVIPTLSVRTLIIKSHSHYHLKLPLPIRTLSTKNIRLVKPSTLYDGHNIAMLLNKIISTDVMLSQRLSVCDESQGAHIADDSKLAYIVRHYPKTDHQCIIPVAALSADENGKLVVCRVADRYYQGDINAFLTDYLHLQLSVHLRLVINYGIALEANQQNSMLLIDTSLNKPRLSLLLKDNDAPRIEAKFIKSYHPHLNQYLDKLKDIRIKEADCNSLIQMFITIILQLNCACIIEILTAKALVDRHWAYQRLGELLSQLLTKTNDGSISRRSSLIRSTLFEADYLDIKYLYTAGTFLPKSKTLATDINKFYGQTARNFIKKAAFQLKECDVAS